MGAPVVLPLKVPERISTLSSSFLCVETMDCPGFLRSTICLTSSSESSSPAGHPSRETPTHLPWLSPKQEKANRLPKVFGRPILELNPSFFFRDYLIFSNLIAGG